jgi:large subunit ribosomal protein L23
MMIELFKNYVLTEKSCRLVDKYNQYTFDVDVKLTKPQIKKLTQDLFKVEVLSVNTHLRPRKKKRLGMSQGYKPALKRVIIKLKKTENPFTWIAEDEKIEGEDEKLKGEDQKLEGEDKN